MNWNNIAEQSFSAFFGVDAMYYAIAAIGLNVQFGYTGLLNFGQAGFMACGAYGLGMAAHYWHVSFWLGILFGILYAIGLGLVMGIPTLRLRADYLAIVTIAMAEVIRLCVQSVSLKVYFGGSDGLNNFNNTYRDLSPFDPSANYPLSPFEVDGVGAVLLVVVFAAVGVGFGFVLWRALRGRFPSVPSWAGIGVPAAAGFGVLLYISTHVEYSGYSLWTLVIGWCIVALIATFVWALMRSPWGRVLKGIREDEDAVRSVGKSVYSYKMQALLIGGVLATFSGMMFSVARGSVQPGNYSRDVTFYVLTALVLGGAAKVTGSIVGPMIFWGILAFTDSFLNQLVESHGKKLEIFGVTLIRSSNETGQVRFVLIGVMLILLMIFRPQGMFGNRREMALDGR
jgi:branched-chain amino acid transport system permease protein